MSNKRRTLPILLTGIIAVTGALIISFHREPSYQGKSLTQWLEYGYHTGLGEIGAREKADAVVLGFGKEAIPTLIQLLQNKNDEYRNYGVSGFKTLGMEAKGALPKVNHLFYNTNFTDAATPVLIAIAPKESLSIFQSGLNNQQEIIRAYSAWGLGSLGSNAVVAVPGLLYCLKDDSSRVREEAATALGKIAQEGEKVIPALVKTLKDPNPWVKTHAIRGIGAFGNQAAAATPDLRQLLSETIDTRVFDAAVDALQAINAIDLKSYRSITLSELTAHSEKYLGRAMQVRKKSRKGPIIEVGGGTPPGMVKHDGEVTIYQGSFSGIQENFLTLAPPEFAPKTFRCEGLTNADGSAWEIGYNSGVSIFLDQVDRIDFDPAPPRPKAKAGPNSPAELVRKGNFHYESGKWEKAKPHFEDALKLEPENKTARYYLDKIQK